MKCPAQALGRQPGGPAVPCVALLLIVRLTLGAALGYLLSDREHLVLATSQKIPEGGTEPFATLAPLARSRAAPGRGAAIPGMLYCALYRPSPHKICALRLQQPNRRAVGAASCQRHASGMTMRGGLRP